MAKGIQRRVWRASPPGCRALPEPLGPDAMDENSRKIQFETAPSMKVTISSSSCRLDDSPSVPKWLPRTQLWLGLKRWGVAGTASAIEARVAELGGEPKEESAIERAVRFKRLREFTAERQAFLNSDAGVNAANSEFDKLTSAVGHLITAIKDSTTIPLQMRKAPGQICGSRVACRPKCRVAVPISQHAASSLRISSLRSTMSPPMAVS